MGPRPYRLWLQRSALQYYSAGMPVTQIAIKLKLKDPKYIYRLLPPGLRHYIRDKGAAERARRYAEKYPEVGIRRLSYLFGISRWLARKIKAASAELS